MSAVTSKLPATERLTAHRSVRAPRTQGGMGARFRRVRSTPYRPEVSAEVRGSVFMTEGATWSGRCGWKSGNRGNSPADLKLGRAVGKRPCRQPAFGCHAFGVCESKRAPSVGDQ